MVPISGLPTTSCSENPKRSWPNSFMKRMLPSGSQRRIMLFTLLSSSLVRVNSAVCWRIARNIRLKDSESLPSSSPLETGTSTCWSPSVKRRAALSRSTIGATNSRDTNHNSSSATKQDCCQAEGQIAGELCYRRKRFGRVDLRENRPLEVLKCQGRVRRQHRNAAVVGGQRGGGLAGERRRRSLVRTSWRRIEVPKSRMRVRSKAETPASSSAAR